MDLFSFARSAVLPGLAIAAGALLPVQAGANAALGRGVGGPVIAVFISLAISAILILLCALAWRAPLPSKHDLEALPAWCWLGGALGAAYLLSVTIVAPRLGAGATLALVVLGQMVCSLTLDHFGLAGFAQRSAEPARLAGVALVAVGAFLVARRA
jgi:bacterial/archaeal transporter family-2 protein